jgi:hypothetical protein
LEVARLCAEQPFPVCSPKLTRGRKRIMSPSDSLNFPLLRLDDWTNWVDGSRRPGLPLRPCPDQS